MRWLLFGELIFERIWLVNLTLAEYVNLNTLIVVRADLTILFKSKKKIMREYRPMTCASFTFWIVVHHFSEFHNSSHSHRETERLIIKNVMWAQHMTDYSIYHCNCYVQLNGSVWLLGCELTVSGGIGYIVNKSINPFGINSIYIYKWQLKKLNTSPSNSVDR